jgi:ATP-binding cassette subfamily F protein uup
MHYASIENISKSFGVRTLFTGISFHIEEGDKIALVARNGSGKSTLLKIIAGLDTADSGTIWVRKEVKVIMLQQETPFDEEKSIWDNILRLDNPVVKVVKEYEMFLEAGTDDTDHLTALMGRLDEHNAWNFENELQQILGKLNLIEAQIHEGKCLLILDEPTNHLDVSMIEWLEDFLSARKITLLLVTHDRYFLDAVCNEIIEIDEGKVYEYRGDYDYFLEQKSLRQEVQQSELQKDKNIYRKELEWMRKQPKARTTKSKSRQDAFAEVQERVSQKKEELDVSCR